MILLFGNVYGLWSRLGALGFSGTGRRVRGEWRTRDKYSGRGRRGTEAPDSSFQEGGGEIRARADREAAADAQRALTAGVQDIRALLSQMAAADVRRALRAEVWEIRAKVDREAAADAQRALIQAVRTQMAAADAQLAELRDIKALLDLISAQLADRHREFSVLFQESKLILAFSGIDRLYLDNANMTMNNGPVFGQTFQTVVLREYFLLVYMDCLLILLCRLFIYIDT